MGRPVTVFLTRRLAPAIASGLLVTLIGFTLMRVAPGDPAQLIALARYGQTTVSAHQIELIRHEERLDAPWSREYLRWLSRVVRGDLGRSLVTGQPIREEIGRRLPATLELAVAGILLSLAISIPAGVASAGSKGSWLDRLIGGATLVGISMPPFWLAQLLILFLAARFRLLPVSGRGGVTHLLLPAVTIALGLAAINARLVRSRILAELAKPYIRSAAAKGLTKRAVLIRHALPNALGPVLAYTGVQFSLLVESAVVTETIFAWPGLGRLLVNAVFDRDFAVMQACLLVMATVVLVASIAIDVVHGLLDPRVSQAQTA